ncbi:MAG: RNA polymerase factor sigma-54 [Clostridia bacterium]|nr:RNA polymerase factor sigma-54 [Clostridia bacterium]
MELSYEMSLRQEQRLVMTPELRQAITILQLPSLDLADYVESQILENPVLEEQEPGSEGAGGSGQAEEAAECAGTDSKADEVEWERYFADGTDAGYTREQRDPDADSEDTTAALARWEPSLAERLEVELHLASECARTHRIGDYLLGCIDEAGFLRGDIGDIADALGVGSDEVESVLHIIQSLDPVGIGSRSVEECLDLQIQALNAPYDVRSLAHRIVCGHLEDMAAGRIGRISSELHVSAREVQAAMDLIRSLNPRPGSCFRSGAGAIRYIIPDVTVELVDGEYIVMPNDSILPRLNVSACYRRLLSSSSVDQTAKDFVKGKLNSALWLIRSIEQRRATILRVTRSIIAHQRDFLDRGILWLKPLTLREVATDVGLHESTVSRATAGKYAETPRGTFELRFFFGSGVSTSVGGAASATSVKKYIREMIASEDSGAPLSDQRIAGILGQQGIEISRRTVAKYREEMTIPSSGKRRRY